VRRLLNSPKGPVRYFASAARARAAAEAEAEGGRIVCWASRTGPDFERETGRQLFETCTWRSQARQQELYQIGRRGIPGEKSVTQLDGVTKRSRHMVFPSEAVDCCVDSDPGPGKHPIWDEAAYAPLAPLALRHGLEWGGAWARLPDPPHLQLPAEAA